MASVILRVLKSLAVALLLLELGSALVLRLGLVSEGATPLTEVDFAARFLQPLHPYTGLPMQKKRDPGETDRGLTVPVRGDEKVHVFLTGASVAYYLHQAKRDYLEAELSKVWGKTRVSVVAKGGLKQPQQLMALTYGAVLGRYPDIVVNLDGFNELAGALVDNFPNRTPLAFPRDWTRTALRSEPEFSGLYLRLRLVTFLADRAVSWSRHLLPSTGRLLSLSAQNGKEKALAYLDRRARDHLNLAYEWRGRVEETAWRGQIDEAVRLWADSSRLIHSFCQLKGIRYLHFLQPNQHLPGSKPLTAAERAHEESIYAAAIAQGYPKLRAQGERLKREGEAFFDLTQLFEGRAEDIYTDSVGHVNGLGNDLLADRLLAELRREPARLASFR